MENLYLIDEDELVTNPNGYENEIYPENPVQLNGNNYYFDLES